MQLGSQQLNNAGLFTSRTLAVRILAVVLPNSYPLKHSGIVVLVEIDVTIGGKIYMDCRKNN